VPPQSPFSTGKLRCAFDNGVLMAILRYDSKQDRDRRAAQILATGVRSEKWNVRSQTGVLLTADSSVKDGPFLWWTFDSAPRYAIFAAWKGHSEVDIKNWWLDEAPFLPR
jgi:hypothetical protein